MVDRQDIDALLISALYGELTPADEARLTTHLESHPADRSTLDSLTEIRATIRTSGFATFHIDPPQAISAMLLQEAARRAPKMVRAKDDNEVGWFTRFVRSFAAHPAIAAATMLVMVAGIGGLVYLKQGNSIAERSISDNAMVAGSAALVAPSSPIEPPSVPGGDNFRVDLADRAEGARTAGSATAASDVSISDGTTAVKKIGKGAAAYSDQENLKDKAEPLERQSVEHGMIVNRDEPAPKELAEEKAAPPKPMVNAPDPQASPGAYAGAGSGATNTTTRNLAPPPPQVSKSPAKTEKSEKSDAATPPRAPPSALFAWAKDQHARVATLVRDGNCHDAATIAAQIAARANDYYNQYVTNDRALKACTAYINDAREKDAERTNKARAQKRVDANEVSPAPAH